MQGLLESNPCIPHTVGAFPFLQHTSDLWSRTITDMNLDGRVAVVTGATKGVGRGIGREHGVEAMHEYTQVKSIWIDLT